jgi:uncharacterized protein DUF5679
LRDDSTEDWLANAIDPDRRMPNCSTAPTRSPRLTPTVTKEDRVAEKYTGEAYCVKCKAKRDFEGEVVVNDKGTKMAKGKCHVCGTTLNRILGKA